MIAEVYHLLIDRSEFFWRLVIEHLTIVGISVSFILVIGLSLGILMTKNQLFANIMLTVTNFVYTVPSIALFGILVTVTGIGDTSAIVALTVYGLLPVVRNTYVGIMEVDSEIIEAAVGMGSTPKQLMLRVQLPLALPYIIAGARTMIVMTVALGGIASFIGAGGLGVAIWRGITTNYPAMTIAGSLLTALISVAADTLFGLMERVLRKRMLGQV